MLSGKMKCRIDLHDVAGDSATVDKAAAICRALNVTFTIGA